MPEIPSVIRRYCLVFAAAIRSGDERPDWLYGLARVVNPDDPAFRHSASSVSDVFNFAILQRPMPHQATAIRRTFLAAGGYDEEFGIAADQLLMLRAAACAPPLPLAISFATSTPRESASIDPWWENYRDGHRMRRHLDAPVTSWRALDTLCGFSFALVRHLAQSFRAAP